MTKQILPNKELYIDCELLNFTNTLVNGELMSYTLSTYTLHFVPMEGDYQVEVRNNSNKTYTNKNEMVWDSPGSSRFGEFNPVDGWCQKVPEYYLAHQSEIETTNNK